MPKIEALGNCAYLHPFGAADLGNRVDIFIQMTSRIFQRLFDTEQPDLNWENPEVFDDFEKTLRFWLERGVDGFRIDVAHGMAAAG